MHSIIAQLLNQRPIIIDGAWGTELQKKQGLKSGESAEALNLNQPEVLEAGAASYVAAGSRIIITNTFGGTRFTLERHGLAENLTARDGKTADALFKKQSAAMHPISKLSTTTDEAESSLKRSKT